MTDLRRFPLVLSLVALALVAGGCGDDDDTSTSSTSAATTTSEEATTTSDATATSEPTTAPGVDTSTAVWPLDGDGISYDDPVAAATGFATDYVGFVDPVVGEFQQGDSRSGEVEVRPAADGPVTTVFVRQLDASDSWWVLGAATANIQIDEPTIEQTVTSPVTLRGTSTAFEATVQTEIRDDEGQTLGEGFVMGGSMGEMGPFDDTLDFTPPATDHGSLMLSTLSMEDGQVWEAAVLRITFG
jgi:hypothetical protein